ncbi:HD domain-containing protein [Spirulina subsalsa]|uniref:HD domain-containing protein n=1 Tax=Spirulina subsalsa TaxID=54311 RepID=UPI0002D4D1A7|nr:HD domain-containing protein [Spirulina subsalsa]
MADLSERFEQALVYATRLHQNQRRKVGKVPYIAHLMAVSALVLEAGGSEEEAIAALLHDAIEDQGGEPTRQDILKRFGPTVAAIVEGCTEFQNLPKPPWQARKIQYLKQIQAGSPSVQLVSLADKLHNGRSLLWSLRQQGSSIWSHFAGGRELSLWFYQSLLTVYTHHKETVLWRELAQVVAELEQF